MARDISERLQRLRDRRYGTDSLGRLNEAAQIEVITKSLAREGWERRGAEPQKHTRYALGAMEELDPASTAKSLESADRVRNQLQTGLAAQGFSVDFKLQGSVPANLHIRNVSDVDLLNLDADFFTYASFGARSRAGYYGPRSSRNSISVLSALRAAAEGILKSKFPAATVDCSGGKAISISGGSLARPVDVVPAHWFDTIEYQSTLLEQDRAVTILDKKVPTTIDNWPFKHIQLIGERDLAAFGGLKKSIRLAKNVKSDAEAEIALPSFDIAATLYHADLTGLRAGILNELAIVAETQRFLDWLTQNPNEAKALKVPDGSRQVFNSQGKLDALRKLSIEMDDLMTAVARELDQRLAGPGVSWANSRAVLANSNIPAAN